MAGTVVTGIAMRHRRRHAEHAMRELMRDVPGEVVVLRPDPRRPAVVPRAPQDDPLLRAPELVLHNLVGA